MRGLLAELCTPTWHTDNVEARVSPPPSTEELRENIEQYADVVFYIKPVPSFIMSPAKMFNVMHRNIGGHRYCV
jgi:hypothetical protein